MNTNTQLARVYGIVLAILAVVGFFVSGHLFQLMNTDLPIDVLRIVLAAYLLYAGFVSKSGNTVNTALLVVGILYLVMGIVGLVSPTIGGILPSGLTGFDIIFHLATGALATYAGARRGKDITSPISS